MNYTRRQYTIEGPELDKQKVSILLKIGGTIVADMQAREPGMVAIVSKPNEQGITFEVVEPGFRFVDHALPDGQQTLPVAPWQLQALEG